MDVIIEQQENLTKDKVVIYCKEENKEIQKIKGYIKSLNTKLCVSSEFKNILVEHDEIYYIESVDKKTFVYLKDKVMECSLKLYEIEDKFRELTFFRANKSTIVNVMYAKDISILLNRNLLLKLENNDKVIISRRNVKEFKKFIGWV